MLADDEELVRRGLRDVLESGRDIRVVGTAADGAELIELVNATPCEVVLVDVRMPGTDGLTALRVLIGDGGSAQQVPAIAVLTTFDLDEYVNDALDAGAMGFLLKDASPDFLRRAVHDLAAGGAVLDPRIVAWFAREEIPFLMEAADRTEADRKGGHIARGPDGGLLLRESAQTPDEDMDAFQDVRRHRYFNSNTLWVDLQALADLLEQRNGFLGLPMIANQKTVDPSDKSSPEVIQVETAMGAALGVFDGAQAVRVPR
ncbi:MAG: UTP--glucose-1-phosphate uridylyltransferase, partial [Pseudonocardiaceae bacterium]